MDSIERQNRNFEYSRYGVDLNRNFKYGWRYSSSPTDYPNTYHGYSAASEPETKAVRAAMAKFRPVFYVNTHTGGNYLSYDRNGDMNDVNAFLTLYTQLANEMRVQKWSTNGGSAGNGMAHGDAKEFGGNGFLFEMSSESGAYRHTSPTLTKIENEIFPRCKPILIAMCQASENQTPSSTVDTPSSSSGTTEPSSQSTPSVDSTRTTTSSSYRTTYYSYHRTRYHRRY